MARALHHPDVDGFLNQPKGGCVRIRRAGRVPCMNDQTPLSWRYLAFVVVSLLVAMGALYLFIQFFKH